MGRAEQKLDKVSGGAGYDRDMIRDIMRVVASKRATYPSEISRLSRWDTDEIADACHKLIEAQVLERPEVNGTWSDDRRVMGRRKELWERGITGRHRFQQMTWVALDTSWNWRLKPENEDFTVNEFHERVEVPGSGVENITGFARNMLEG